MTTPKPPPLEPAITRTLAQTRRYLLETGVTGVLWRAATSRGCPPEAFQKLHALFVRRYHRQTKGSGAVILDHPAKARYYGLQFLSDHGWKA